MRGTHALALATIVACARHETPSTADAAITDSPAGSIDAAASSTAVDAAPPPQPVRFDRVPVPNDRRAVVLRGPHEHRLAMVFLHGMCVYPGY